MLANCEVASPRTNIRDIGEPRRIPLDQMTPAQLGSIRYDWTPWDEQQLRAMEVLWDEWASFYKRFVPAGLSRGVNLGTHNGAIQKALQRVGYDMYGVEYTDHLDQLHAYGCRGERGNFFNMPQIETDRFDFAIIDRALCSNRLQSWQGPEGQSTEKHMIDYYTDVDGQEKRSGPPFFDEAERIVRPGGVLVVSFRAYVSRLWIDDLAARGHLAIALDNRKYPYFICTLFVGTQPEPIPALDEFMQRALADPTIITTANRCARIRVRNSETGFLYVPDNRYVTVRHGVGTYTHVPLFEHPQDTRKR